METRDIRNPRRTLTYTTPKGKIQGHAFFYQCTNMYSDIDILRWSDFFHLNRATLLHQSSIV